MRRTALILFLVPLAVLLAACGDDSGSSSGTTTKRAATSTTVSSEDGTGAQLMVGSTGLGKVLVDAQGRTLYAFTPDTATTSNCTDKCATTWPPATATGTPTADGVEATDITVIDRADGTKQIAVAGHPLYTYAADKAPGDTNGQGSGGKWFVVSADGSLMKTAAAESTTTTTSDGGY